jgi:hypothetical protein
MCVCTHSSQSIGTISTNRPVKISLLFVVGNTRISFQTTGFYKNVYRPVSDFLKAEDLEADSRVTGRDEMHLAISDIRGSTSIAVSTIIIVTNPADGMPAAPIAASVAVRL